ncbi:hypothetical protein [Streptomyces lunalinharesii]|uniref:WXG100 family type VII secretion target n=1 Tax=Streptomyces lunalinharesii TaxID=333384 RepID=A0ABN3SW88_9ACTN
MRPTLLTDEDYTANDMAEVHRQMDSLLAEIAVLAKRTDEQGQWAPASSSRLAQLKEAQQALDQLYAALRSVRTAVSNADAAAGTAFSARAEAVHELPEYVLAPH